MKNLAFEIRGLGYFFVSRNDETLLVPSMVASTLLRLAVVTFIPWAIPLIQT